MALPPKIRIPGKSRDPFFNGLRRGISGSRLSPGMRIFLEIMFRWNTTRAPTTDVAKFALPRDGELLAQLRDQGLDAAAVALDHRGELVALRHLHADAADIDIGDLVGTAADQVPVDRDAAATGANDLADDDRLLPVRAHAGDAERLAAVLP